MPIIRNDVDKEIQARFDALVERIRQNDPSLTEVNFSRTPGGSDIYGESDWISPQLTKSDLSNLADALNSNTHLTTLKLAKQFEKTEESRILAILPALAAHSTLINIDLSFNGFGALPCSLAKIFSETKTPKNIDLSLNDFTDIQEWMEDINENVQVCFSHNPMIEPTQLIDLQIAQQGGLLSTLNLAGHRMDATIFSRALEHCSERNAALTELNLDNTFTRDIDESTVIQSLLAFLKTISTLKIFNINYNNLSDKGIYQLMVALQPHSALQELHIGYNHASSCVTNYMQEFMAAHPQLKILKINGNRLGKGIQQIFNVAANSQLVHLELSSNQSIYSNYVGENFCFDLSSLKNNNSLIIINLASNDICFIKDQKMLEKNNSVKYLNLACNQLDEATGVALKNRTQGKNLVINLYGNHFDIPWQPAPSNPPTTFQWEGMNGKGKKRSQMEYTSDEDMNEEEEFTCRRAAKYRRQ